MRRFEDLRIWQESRIFVQEIYFLNKDLKDYGFKDQIQRASVSIMNNIAEGCDSGTDSLYVRAQRKNKTNYIRHSKINYLFKTVLSRQSTVNRLKTVDCRP